MFAQMETDFPRGRNVRQPNYETKTLKKDADLFQAHSQPSEEKRGKKRKRIRLDKDAKKKRNDWEPLELDDDHIEPLNFTSLCPGMLVLGLIKRVHDYKLLVSLPGGHTGTVAISSVSDEFTKILQKMTQSKENMKDLSEDVSSLQAMFHSGMLLRCKILQIIQEDNGKRVINLTINPREIYEYLSLETLKNKMILTGTVRSQEDHGYQMDIGVDNVNAFVNKKAASKYITEVNKGQPLAIGQYMHCMINMPGPKGCSVSESRSLKLAVNPDMIKEGLEAESELKILQHLYPGMLVSATITKVTENGLLVQFFSFRGFIHRSHLRTIHENPDMYSEKNEILACVLYIYPITNIVALSLMPHLCQPEFRSMDKFANLLIGDLVENAKIVCVKETGIYVKFKGFIGFVRTSHLSSKRVSNPQEKFSQGQTCKCLVLNFNYLDNHVILSMQESLLNQQFYNYRHINVGDFAEGEVLKITPIGMTLKIGRNIFGFAHKSHLADIPLSHPDKKFKIGNKVKCRVLLVDADQNKLYLTCKKSLLHPNLPVLSNYKTINPNTVTEGVIANINEKGLVVKFFNNIQGWVPRQEMSNDSISFPEKDFFFGQIVKCRVVKVSPETEKMFLSLRLFESAKPILKTINNSKDLVGKLADCKVIKKTNQGLDVCTLSSNNMAFIPKNYLSDYIGHSHLLWGFYKEGDVIQDCLCFDATKSIIMTKKKMLIEAEQNDVTIHHFDDIKAGVTLVGIVGSVVSFGIFVHFPNGLLGLAPKKLITDAFIESTSGVFISGQTVLAKIIEINEEKKRFLVGLRLQDCYDGDIEIGLDYLQAFLEENRYIQQSYSSKYGDLDMGILSQVSVGSIIVVKINAINNNSILCETESGLHGFVPGKEISEFDGQVGNKVPAVVLFVNLENKCLELSLDKSLIKQIKKQKDSETSKARVDQTMKANIILIKEDFVLVSLTSHCRGILAYMPAKRNCNDYSGKKRFSMGMKLPVEIKRVIGNLVLVTIYAKKQLDDIPLANIVKKPSRLSHNLKVGEIHQAIIKKIKPMGLIIDINGTEGFVHISRIKDINNKNENVIKGLKNGQEVEVRVINIWNYVEVRRMAITRHFMTGRPLFTMKESELHSDDVLSSITKWNITKSLIGQRIPAFFFKFTTNSLIPMQIDLHVHGCLDILDLSNDIGILINANKFLKPYICYYPLVRSIENHQVILSFTELLDLEADTEVCAQVDELLPTSKLIVRLPCGYRGEAELVNLTDNYDKVGNVFEHLQPRKFIKVYIISINKTERIADVSLRPSRFSKQLEIKDPEVNCLQDIHEGQLLRGFVTNSNASGLFISLGTGLESFVPLSAVLKFKSIFEVGELVTTKIIRVKDNQVMSLLV